MHEWGDEWFEKYGKDLYAAEQYIYRYVKRFSRCTLISKEKYGSIRYEYIFPPYGGCSIRPNWVDKVLSVFGQKKIECFYNNQDHSFYTQRFLWHKSRLYRWWGKWGRYCLHMAILNAIVKWPHIRQEILADYDNGEYISG